MNKELRFPGLCSDCGEYAMLRLRQIPMSRTVEGLCSKCRVYRMLKLEQELLEPYTPAPRQTPDTGGKRKLCCPGCGKFAGHDREYPPNPYYCDECATRIPNTPTGGADE